MLGQETEDTVEQTVEQIEETLESALLDVAKQLGQAIRLRGFYPKGHVAVGSALSRLKGALEPLLTSREEITIGSTGESLLFERMPFGGNDKPAKRLAEYLRIRDISGVTVRSGVQQSELEGAIEVLSEAPEVFASPDSPLLKPGSQSEHVEFRQIHYDRILRHVSEEDAKLVPPDDMHDIWRSLIEDDLGGKEAPLPDHAMAMIRDSVQDRASFKRMADQLIKAGRHSGSDPADVVARGVRKTCQGLAGLSAEKKTDGMSFLSDALQEMPPDIVLRLLETQGQDAGCAGEDLVVELTQSLPVGAKLGVLAALMHSKRRESSRVSAVFSRIAGVEKRRNELLNAMRSGAAATAETKDDGLNQVWSVLQDLVISETEEKFIGSEYAAMLESLGEDNTVSNDEIEEESEHLDDLKSSLDPDKVALTRARFLIDLGALQNDVPKMKQTLSAIGSTCSLLREKGDIESVASVACELSEVLAELDGNDTGRAEALCECLRSNLDDDTARLALEKMAPAGPEGFGPLRAALSALGDNACKYVCGLAAGSDAALGNEEIQRYLGAHADAAARICGEALPESPAPHSRRLLRVLCFLDTTEAIDHMESALEHHEPSVQAEAIRMIARSDTKRARQALQKLLGGADHVLAGKAATALGEVGSNEAAGILLDALNNLDLFGKRIHEVTHATAALGSMKYPDAVPDLERILNRRLWAASDKRMKLRETAAMALANIADDRALAALQRGESGRNKQVRQACRKALERQERARGRHRNKRRDLTVGTD